MYSVWMICVQWTYSFMVSNRIAIKEKLTDLEDCDGYDEDGMDDFILKKVKNLIEID